MSNQSGLLAALTYLDARKPKLQAVVPNTLSDSITFELIRSQVGQAVSKSKALQECSAKSIYESVLYIVQHGLEIGPPAGQAFLVPFWDRNLGRKRCTPLIGAQGKIEMANRSGLIKAMTVQAVHDKDHFVYDFLRPEALSHRPAYREDRGGVLTVYAAIWLHGSDVPHLEMMSRPDFEKIRDTARRKNNDRLSPAYKEWPTEMWRRSCLNRALKRAPKSKDLLRVLRDEVALNQGALIRHQGQVVEVVESTAAPEVFDADDFEIEEPAGELADTSDEDALEAYASESETSQPEAVAVDFDDEDEI